MRANLPSRVWEGRLFFSSFKSSTYTYAPPLAVAFAYQHLYQKRPSRRATGVTSSLNFTNHQAERNFLKSAAIRGLIRHLADELDAHEPQLLLGEVVGA